MEKRVISYAAAALAFLLLLPSVLSGTMAVDTATPQPSPEPRAVISNVTGAPATVQVLTEAGGNVVYAQETVPPGNEGTGEPTSAAPGLVGEEAIVEERTPAPTATPGRLEEQIAQVAQATGLNRVTLLGLTGEDWLNLGISLLIVLLAYLLASWLLWGPLRGLAQRNDLGFVEEALTAVGPHLRWLIVILSLSFATARLDFVSAEVKQLLRDFYFLVSAVLALVIAFRLVNLGFQQYRVHVIPEADRERLDPILTLVRRLVLAFVSVTGLIVILSYFGINVTALTASLGLAGLALSLAAQDTLSDAISGFIILIDQPFRVGDRIQIAEEQTWGDVVEIGARTTRIRTRDNRLVIVPNSTISKSQVVNYTYPDPEYRVETHLGIAYGTDIEKARRIIVETVRQVPGVLPNRSVDALYNELGDTAMIFRVRWWIESYVDTRRVYDRVHTALQNALDAAGIEMPYPTGTVNLRMAPEVTQHLREA